MAKRTEGLSFYRRKKKINSGHLKELFSWIISILIVIFAACALVMLYGMTSSVVGISMEPGLKSEQKILVDRFVYVLGKPKAGDVVLFLPNGNENAHYYTKRVVAVPGDTVLIENGRLYVNGELSTVVTQYIVEPGIAENEIELSTGQFFVLGDAPSDSEDSRSSGLGPVDVEDIVGRVWFKLPCENGKMGFVK
ncbi:MAG: signal peptidase I [Lachnospiraceae bacterium]|nr:signal peptidase I [Lachnospiraceae bacterium]